MPKRPKPAKWTPPIFGWQYRIHWESPEVCGTWDHQDWLPDYPYRLWVQGRLNGALMHWSVYLMLVGLDHVRVVSHSTKSLDAAVRALHRQVAAMRQSLQQLDIDQQKA